MATELTAGVINVYVLWPTAYFIYVFMVLERKRALIFFISIAIGILYFSNARANDTLIQYYISTLISLHHN